MKFDHTTSYFYKFYDEEFDIEFDWTNSLATGQTLNSCVITVTDSDGNDVTSAMTANQSVASPYFIWTIRAGAVNNIYYIKLVGTTNDNRDYVSNITCEVYGGMTLNPNLGDPSCNSYVTLQEANEYIMNVRGHSSIWDTLSSEGKKRALVEACKDIDRYNFVGNKYYDNQSMEFPRNDHDVLTGNCATPITSSSFKNTNFTSDTYGNVRSNTDYWKYGTVHITSATPLYDIRRIETSNVTTDVVTVATSFSATPTANTEFIAFEPLDKRVKDAQCEQALYLLKDSGSGTMQSYKSMGAEYVKIGDTSVKFGEGATSRIPLSSVARKLLSKWIVKYRRVLRA